MPLSQYTPSPCLRLCALDPQQRCIGCGRHLDDIKAWGMMSDENKQQWWLTTGVQFSLRHPAFRHRHDAYLHLIQDEALSSSDVFYDKQHLTGLNAQKLSKQAQQDQADLNQKQTDRVPFSLKKEYPDKDPCLSVQSSSYQSGFVSTGPAPTPQHHPGVKK